ncbi:MAG: GrpB family protein [Armatimonadetes bacterium]|nr:GrpB family protein [Armatimonadota bacterium]
MLGCERHLVRLVPYEPAWAEMFREEEARLRTTLGDHVVRIEHVGSTSVPGLHAKPILDIVLAVRDMSQVTTFEQAVAPLGYLHKADNDMPGRLYFVKRLADDRSTHHLNITELGTDCWFSHVAFRDYLRACRESMEEYRELKQELAREHPQDRPAYLAAKEPFIARILDLARKAEAERESEQ